MRKSFYLFLAILGTILPYYFLVSFLACHGVNFDLIWQQLFLSQVGAFFLMDVLVSSIVLWVFIFAKGYRLGMRYL